MKNEIWSNFDFSRQLFKTLNFILYKFVGNFLKINGNSFFSRVNYGFIFKWEGGRGLFYQVRHKIRIFFFLLEIFYDTFLND